jgi:hypothetical protein
MNNLEVSNGDSPKEKERKEAEAWQKEAASASDSEPNKHPKSPLVQPHEDRFALLYDVTLTFPQRVSIESAEVPSPITATVMILDLSLRTLSLYVVMRYVALACLHC